MSNREKLSLARKDALGSTIQIAGTPDHSESEYLKPQSPIFSKRQTMSTINSGILRQLPLCHPIKAKGSGPTDTSRSEMATNRCTQSWLLQHFSDIFFGASARDRAWPIGGRTVPSGQLPAKAILSIDRPQSSPTAYRLAKSARCTLWEASLDKLRCHTPCHRGFPSQIREKVLSQARNHPAICLFGQSINPDVDQHKTHSFSRGACREIIPKGALSGH